VINVANWCIKLWGCDFKSNRLNFLQWGPMRTKCVYPKKKKEKEEKKREKRLFNVFNFFFFLVCFFFP
jgi:hypothetical protein